MWLLTDHEPTGPYAVASQWGHTTKALYTPMSYKEIGDNTMANETSNQTADNNMTAEENNTAEEGNLTAIIDTVEESGLLDTLMDEPLLMALVGLLLVAAGYIAYTVPAVKMLVFKYLKNNEAELMDLLDKNLTKAQQKVFEKMDETAQKHVKDSLVKNVLITAWDEKDDELSALVKSKVKAALDEQK